MKNGRQTSTVVKVFAAQWVLLPLCYIAYPACGPAFAFPRFPELPALPLVPHPIALDAPPNAVPSGHFAAALLVAWFLWPWKWGRAVGVIFACLTILATLGSGQHYAWDLVASVPYVGLILWFASLAGEGSRQIASGVLVAVRAPQPQDVPTQKC